jgi:hypothetical protein
VAGVRAWRLIASRARRGGGQPVAKAQAAEAVACASRGRRRVAPGTEPPCDKPAYDQRGWSALKHNRALDPRHQRCRNTQVGVMPGAATLDGAGALLPESREFVDGAAACGKDATRSRP